MLTSKRVQLTSRSLTFDKEIEESTVRCRGCPAVQTGRPSKLRFKSIHFMSDVTCCFPEVLRLDAWFCEL